MAAGRCEKKEKIHGIRGEKWTKRREKGTTMEFTWTGLLLGLLLCLGED